MPFTADPVYDAELYAQQQERRIMHYPVCACCGYQILDEELFDINGELYHASCASKEFKRHTEDYTE